MDEEKFTKGFNNGYLLAQHRPELLKSIMPSLTQENDYTDGIKLGAQEFDKEKSRTIIQGKEQPDKGKNMSMDI